MNKKTVSITALVAGIITAIVALFYLIIGIREFFYFDFNNEAKNNIYYITNSSELIALGTLLGIFSIFIIKKYFSNDNNKKYMDLPAMIYFAAVVITTFVAMCFWGFDKSNSWVALIFSVVGFVFLLFVRLEKVSTPTCGILILIALLIGFVLTIINLASSSGVGIALNIFVMFMFVAYFLYYLFDMLVDGSLKK